MAIVRARIEDCERGALPYICVKTGLPAEVTRKVEIRRTPNWPIVLIIFGFIPFVVASLLATERVRAVIPFSAVADRRIRRARTAGFALLLGIPLGVAVAATIHEPWPLLVSLACLLLALCAAAWSDALSVGGRIEDRYSLRLTRVSPAFANAVAVPPVAAVA
jgi:hypothetical protein